MGQIQSATDALTQVKSLLNQQVSATPQVGVVQKAPDMGPTSPVTAEPPQASNVFTLTQFERARVTYQAQGSFDGRNYAYNATLTYERVAYSQGSSQPPVQPPASSDDSAVPVPASADDETPSQAATPLPASSADTSVVAHHVIVNATTVWYRQLTTHTLAAPAATSAASAPSGQTSSAAPDESTVPATQTEPAIKKLSLDDFAALRSRTFDRSRESTLNLKLTTQEGDLIELTFKQLDVLTQTRLKGVTETGERIRAGDTTRSSERNVSMQITGDLSDAEKAAIDSVLQNVIDVANQFFQGDLRSAAANIADAQIDMNQLANVSLQMSMSQHREMNKVTVGNDGGLMQLAHRDRGVGQALEFLADQQRTLIAAAKTQFDDHSAVKLVKELLPALIAPPQADTATQGAVDAQPPASDSTTQTDAAPDTAISA